MSTSWYQKRLSGGAPPTPAQLPTAPAPQQVTAYPQPQPQAPASNPESLSEALADPNVKMQGGLAAKTEHASCPGCGSRNFFSRANAEGAKPRCYDCGYPVIQFASDLGEGGSTQKVQGG